jgi:2-dehydropantoate 2-reductase
MRVAVVGAGSIGGFVAARFALAGARVSVVARGENFRALREQGLRLTAADGTEQCVRDLSVVGRIADLGEQDLLILGVKAHQVQPLVPELQHILSPRTTLIPMQNGIPWWYFQRHGGVHEGQVVESVDPGGAIMRAIDPARIVGCVVYPACDMPGPGHIRHVEGERFPLGELDGSETVRLREASEAFIQAGLKAPMLDTIRSEIWLKLWGNLSFNPISALAHATLLDICQYPLSRELAASMMREAEAVAGRLGISFRVSLEKRIAGAERVGRHKTSMLQDIEAGREPETDALVGSVIELGRITATPTPHIDAVYALMKLLSHRMSTERVCVRAQAQAPAERPAAASAQAPLAARLAVPPAAVLPSMARPVALEHNARL